MEVGFDAVDAENLRGLRARDEGCRRACQSLLPAAARAPSPTFAAAFAFRFHRATASGVASAGGFAVATESGT